MVLTYKMLYFVEVPEPCNKKTGLCKSGQCALGWEGADCKER